MDRNGRDAGKRMGLSQEFQLNSPMPTFGAESWEMLPYPRSEKLSRFFLPQEEVYSRYTLCWGCRNHCGVLAKTSGGIVREIRVNPYHPISDTSRALYETPLDAAKVWQTPLLGCSETSRKIDALYDPLRVFAPLKRLGPRGSGKWEIISWEQLIEEVVHGGKLFRHIATEAERVIGGFASIYNEGTNQNVPIDPTHPDMGPATNGLVIYMSESEDGPRQFIDRFARSFGTVNVFDAAQTKDENGQVALRLSGVSKASSCEPDISHAEFVLGFGLSHDAREWSHKIKNHRQASNFLENLTMHSVDVRADSPWNFPGDFTLIRPGGDGALAMGLVRWILDNNAYDSEYLSIPSAQGANKHGQPNFTNATWLVNVDGKSARQGTFLTVQEAGLTVKEPSFAKDGVVLDFGSHRLTPSSSSEKALWTISSDYRKPLRINGIHCRTAFQILWQEAHRYSLEEYAHFAGVSEEVLERLAQEFTRHGKQAVADFSRGAVMHTNGVYTARAIFTLNLLVGNVDWVGGYVIGGGGADLLGREQYAHYHLDHWPHENLRVPYGVNLSRTGVSYEGTSYFAERIKQGQSPYPAIRPWFPYSRGLWEEMFAGLYQGYPYRGQIVVQYRSNPARSAPAIAGGGSSPWADLMTDLGKVPLFIAIDRKISDSSQYADYIVPDTIGWEEWGFSESRHYYPAKAIGVGSPVVKPLTGSTSQGESMSMEQFFIDVAKRLRLPGFGAEAFLEGGNLDNRAQYYLKMLTNLAYDTSYVHVNPDQTISQGSVPDGEDKDLEVIASWYRRHPDALRQEEWRKVAYVMARGGRFEDYGDAYEPGSLGIMHRQSLPMEENWAEFRQEAAGRYRDVFYPPITAGPKSWMAHRFGRAKPLQIYSQEQALMRNALTGAHFVGTGSYQPLQNMIGQHVDQADFVQGYSFVLTSRKTAFELGRHLTVNKSNALSSLPDIDMNPEDAAKHGLADKEVIRVISPSYSGGVSARVRFWPQQRLGVLSFVQGPVDTLGPWPQVDSRNKGNTEHSIFNALIRSDESLQAGPFWSIALEDPIGGGTACYETRVKIEKLEKNWPRDG